MKKNLLIIIGVALSLSILVLSTASAAGLDITGMFKAFDKTIYAGDSYENNITVRKYYNVSIRFRKENSSSYLGFSDNDTMIVLKDSENDEIRSFTEVTKGKIYDKMDNYELGSAFYISCYNLSDYEDVVDYVIEDSDVSFIGSKAYITVTLSEKTYQYSMIAGYVTDGLTGELVSGVSVYAFEDGADVEISEPIEECVTDENGRYTLEFELGSKKTIDVYVEGYDVA